MGKFFKKKNQNALQTRLKNSFTAHRSTAQNGRATIKGFISCRVVRILQPLAHFEMFSISLSLWTNERESKSSSIMCFLEYSQPFHSFVIFFFYFSLFVLFFKSSIPIINTSLCCEKFVCLFVSEMWRKCCLNFEFGDSVIACMFLFCFQLSHQLCCSYSL